MDSCVSKLELWLDVAVDERFERQSVWVCYCCYYYDDGVDVDVVDVDDEEM